MKSVAVVASVLLTCAFEASTHLAISKEPNKLPSYVFRHSPDRDTFYAVGSWKAVGKSKSPANSATIECRKAWGFCTEAILTFGTTGSIEPILTVIRPIRSWTDGFVDVVFDEWSCVREVYRVNLATKEIVATRERKSADCSIDWPSPDVFILSDPT